jgi:probable F420-dependent oxidoreductase
MRFGWFGAGTGVLGDLAGVVECGRAAEALGYESIWVGEHVVLIDPQQRPSPQPPKAHMLDPIVVLSHLAAATTTLRLGSGIIVLPLRNPVVLAKQVASLDVLSEGRLILGIGVGYVPGEFEAVGVPFHQRGRVADDAIDAMRSLWCDEHPAAEGRFFSFSGVQSYPRPVQAGGVPIHGSGMSPGALKRSAERCDGWYGFFLDVAGTERVLAELRALPRPSGRPPLEITVTPAPHSFTAADVGRYEDLGVDRLVLMGDFGELGDDPTPERRSRVLADMARWAAELELEHLRD